MPSSAATASSRPTRTRANRANDVLEQIRRSRANRVKVAITDLDGILRGKFISREKFLSAAAPPPAGGIGFCDVVFGWDSHDACYDNAQLTGWHKGFPDALVRLDLTTHRSVPWDNDVPFFPGEFVRRSA